MEKIYITLKQAGELIPRKPETIRSWIKKGLINNYGDSKLTLVDADEVLNTYEQISKRFTFEKTVEEVLEETPDIVMKHCPNCNQDLPATADFYNKNGNSLQSWCRQCNANNMQTFVEKNPDYGKESYARNRWETIISTHASQARALGLPDDFTITQWEGVLNYFNNSCAYCGSNKNIQVEHIIPKTNNGGFTKNNIICACAKCNKSKDAKDLYTWAAKKNINLDKVSKYLDFIKEN